MIKALRYNGSRGRGALSVRGWPPLLLLSAGIACSPPQGAHLDRNPGVIAGAPPRCDSLPSTADSAEYRVIGPIENVGPQRSTGVGANVRVMDQVLPAARQGDAGSGFVMRRLPPSVFVYARMEFGSRERVVPIVVGEAPADLTRSDGLTPGEASDATELDPRVLEEWLAADSLGLSATPAGPEPAGASRLYAALAPMSDRAQPPSVFTVRLPVRQPVTAPVPDSKHHIFPRYPDGAQTAGVGGTVRLQFVVDEQGIAVSPSIRVIASHLTPAEPPQNPAPTAGVPGGRQVPIAVPVDPRDFAVASIRAVKEQRYIPASIAGCAVKAVVETSFLFRMHDR